jgi:phosphoribosylaminoimidazolecarboxamide formyltransferase/IMP cyclohydrolase
MSVSDKSELLELAAGLHEAGVQIVSTGSTATTIAAAGVPVTPVEKLTGFPECLDGRVKTLHPWVHAGLLADSRKPEHVTQLTDLGIEPFDLLVVNLYPFQVTVASGANFDECVEQIDIGGPAMVRAAAKNHASVAVVVNPAAYTDVLDAVRAGGFTLEQRQALAVAAFRHTADYDIAVASWMGSSASENGGFPSWVGASWQRVAALRYGENPHQRAALYTGSHRAAGGLAGAEQLHGKAMSYNNYVDADAAWRAAHDHDIACVAIIKHANPCGRRRMPRAPWMCWPARRTCGCCGPRRPSVAVSSSVRCLGGYCCRPGTRSTLPVTIRRPGPWPPAHQRTGRHWPT